jgi:hypothetical protein
MTNWRLVDFLVAFDNWIVADDPSDDFRFWVMVWVQHLETDPRYAAAPVMEVGEGWWFARVPGAEDDRCAVVCLYSIRGDEVRCSHFTTLNKPIPM